MGVIGFSGMFSRDLLGSLEIYRVFPLFSRAFYCLLFFLDFFRVFPGFSRVFWCLLCCLVKFFRVFLGFYKVF